jgi:hypothetical protein
MNVSIPASPISAPRNYELADWYQERIHIQFDQFVEQLSDDETYTTKVILQSGEIIWPRAFGYHNPNMLVVSGLDDNGNEVILLTPHTTTQVIFIKMKKAESVEPKREPLGFHVRPPSEEADPATDQSFPADLLQPS